MKYFELKTTDRIAPGQGEDLGCMLGTMAQEREDAMRAGPGSVEYWASTVATLYHLAADAFRAGSAASIGHNRSARYDERARELRAKGDALFAEGRKAHEDRENEALQKGFAAGYAGESSDPFSFDRREAYFVGRHFAQQKLPVPSYLRSVYGDRKHHIEADGKGFRVDYPNGRIDPATVTVVAI